MTQEQLPFVLLNLAGLFIIIYLLLQHGKNLKRLEDRRNPEVIDLTPSFMDIQERITSEAEESRKQQDSHCKNNQTAIRTLTGVVKKLPTQSFIYDEHKKTRKETQELKTGNEWAKKRDHEMLGKLDELVTRRIAQTLESGADFDIQADSSLPEGTMVLRDEGDEVTITNVTAESLVKAAKKAKRTKKKSKTSK